MSSNTSMNRARRAELRARTDAQLARDLHRVHPDGLSHCNKCDTYLPIEEFGRDVGRVDTLRQTCTPCRHARRDARR